MQRMQYILLLLMISLIVSLPAQARRLTACVDQNWFPYTFLASYKGSGIYVDMFHEAGNRLGLKTRVKAVGWGRCVEYLHQGEVDVVLGIAYSEPRTEFLHFPLRDSAPDFDYRLNTLEDVVVTLTEQNFEYTGDPATIPQPVRAPQGYLVTKKLAADGLKVDDSAGGDRMNLINLMREQSGSAVMLRQLAQAMSAREFYEGNLHISAVPYTSRRYFMAFSVHTDYSDAERWEIWRTLKSIREDSALMQAIEANYIQ